MSRKRLKKIDQHRFEITFEGDIGQSQDVTLPAFYQQLQKVHRLLTKIELKYSKGASATRYMVVDLSHSSPATVVIEAQPLPKRPDFSIPVMQGFNAALHAAYTGRNLDGMDDDILEDLRDIAKPVGKQIQSFIISTSKESYEFSEKVTKQIEAELAASDFELGTAEGVLEQINIHGDQKYFHIYSDAGCKKLKCRFPAHLVDEATAAIGRKVSVFGLLKYRAKAMLPFEINVQEIEIFPPDSELPDFDDLRGKAPDIMGGKTSEEFIVELRNDWQ